MSLKQKYLLNNGPYQINFELERKTVLERLLNLIVNTPRNQWFPSGLNCGSLIESYKQVYGLHSHQLEQILALLMDIGIEEPGLAIEVRVQIVKTINRLTQYQIKLTNNLSVNNQRLLMLMLQYVDHGIRGTMKNEDIFMEEFAKMCMNLSQFGQDVVEHALEIAIEHRDLRFVVLFIRSLKNQIIANKLLKELFVMTSFWDRNISWFYILSAVMEKFPRLNYAPYYEVFLQKVIKTFTTLSDPPNEECIKFFINTDSFLKTRSIVRSIALCLVSLMVPKHYPEGPLIWSSIQRIFSLIALSLNPSNEPVYLTDYFLFLRAFLKCYLKRYRKQKGIFVLDNEDYIDDPIIQSKKCIIDQELQAAFDDLWIPIVPKLLYFEDGDAYKPSKILSELSIYKPNLFLGSVLESIKGVLKRDDFTMISLLSTKMTILFLQQFIIQQQDQHLSAYIDCCRCCLSVSEKLGLSENLDCGELVLRSFIFFNDKQLASDQIELLIDDILHLILSNLDAISIGLETVEAEQAELYIDLSNIFLPFFIRVTETQLKYFTNKFFKKLISQTPQHQKVYEMLSITLSYINPLFTDSVMQFIYTELVSEKVIIQKHNGLKSSKTIDGQCPLSCPFGLHLNTRNQNNLRWYGELVQCIFQYHPDNIIKWWPRLENIILLLLSDESQSFVEVGLDIIYNILLCLCHQQIDAKELVKSANANYRSLLIKWQVMKEDVKVLIEYIFNKFYLELVNFMHARYDKLLAKGIAEQLNSDGYIQCFKENDSYHFRTVNQPKTTQNIKMNGTRHNNAFEPEMSNKQCIKLPYRVLCLLDSLLVPDLPRKEQIDQRKMIFKLFTVQYTVMSALTLKTPQSSQLLLQGCFSQEHYLNLRKNACQYLKWLLQLFCHFNVLNDPQFLKIYNFMWRQAHDQLFYSAALNSSLQKITQYYYPQMYRRKQLLHSPYLIVNQTYMLYMMRIQLLGLIRPTADQNDPNYLSDASILAISNNFELPLTSFVDNTISIHYYHRMVIALCCFHMSPQYQRSYCNYYLNSTDNGKKQVYLSAIKILLICIKKLQNVYNYQCCLIDDMVRWSMMDIVGLYRLLNKKQEKKIILEIYYLMLMFSFDAELLRPHDAHTFKWDCQKTCFESKVVTLKTAQQLVQVLMNLTPVSHCDQSPPLAEQLQVFIGLLLDRIRYCLITLEKDVMVYVLMLAIYSNLIPLTSPCIGQALALLFELVKTSLSELYDIAKIALFRLINRFYYAKTSKRYVLNTPVRRDFNEFLQLRLLGGEQVDYNKIVSDKSQNSFYRKKELIEITHFSLGETMFGGSQQTSLENEKTLLELFEGQALCNFLKNAIYDPDLKQNDTQMLGLEEQSSGMSTKGHRLLFFFWEQNRRFVDSFAGFVQNLSCYPQTFYSRLLRRVLRLGSQQTRANLISLAQQMRQNNKDIEQIRLSLYVSTQLFFSKPQHEANLQFVLYLTTCTKQIFQFAQQCLYAIFSSNFKRAQHAFEVLWRQFKPERESSRLRRLQLLNIYISGQGRFARRAAKQCIRGLSDINEGSTQVADVIVTMLAECFIIAIDLQSIGQWVNEPINVLEASHQLYVLDDKVGYEMQSTLKQLLSRIIARTKQEQNYASANLKTNSQISKKILTNLAIRRFNQCFFDLLGEMIYYLIDKTSEDLAEDYTIWQLKDSEYPEPIYEILFKHLTALAECTPNVARRKLRYLEGIVINRSFFMNQVTIPQIIPADKVVLLDYIIGYSNMAKIMTADELAAAAQTELATDKPNINKLMAYLLAAGVRQMPWKQRGLVEILKQRKSKIVKQFISQWWKGKSSQTEQELRLSLLVKNVQNPYSYFA